MPLRGRALGLFPQHAEHEPRPALVQAKLLPFRVAEFFGQGGRAHGQNQVAGDGEERVVSL